VLPILLALGAFCVHAARSGMGVRLGRFRYSFDFEPALFWWPAVAIVCVVLLFWLRSLARALGPGQTITLTEDNLIFSRRADRERIPYRAIDDVRCVDVSQASAAIVIKAGRVERRLDSVYFDSLPDFYAFWSALRMRLKPAGVQATEPDESEQYASQRAVESLLFGPKRIGIGTGILILVIATVVGVRHQLAQPDAVPIPVSLTRPDAVPLPAAPTRPAVSVPQAVFVRETIVTAAQRAEFERLHLDMPFRRPLVTTSWVVDREQQVYFVQRGGGHDDIPYLFALVLPREGITVHVEAGVTANGSLSEGLEMNWIITSVRLGREHESAAPRYLELVRQAMLYLYLHTDDRIKKVNLRLPPPTFT
jgi:hypothetical protein